MDEKDKDKEIAATNRLLNVIRGENSTDDPDKGKQGSQGEIPVTSGSKNEGPSAQGQSSKERVEGKKGKTPDISASSSRRHTALMRQAPLLPPKRRKGNWLRWLKKTEKRAIGLDIGSHSIKYVLLQKGIAGVRLMDYRIAEIPIEQGEESVTITANILKSLLSKLDLSKGSIVSSLSGPSVIVRHVQFPPMSDKELAQSLKWEAKSYIPFPLNEINLDYQLLPKSDVDQRLDVILVAVTKKILKAHLDLLKTVSIEPDIIDIDPLVIINTYMAMHEEKGLKTFALINIGAKSSILSIYRPGSLFFTRDIHIAGDAFTKQIESQWKVSYEEAESIKKGAIPEDIQATQGKDLEKVLKPVLSELISEIRRSLIYYDNQTGKRGFSHLVLTGGGALLKGLPELLESELGLDVEYLNPLAKLHIDETDFPSLLIKEQAERLSISVGLAMRGIA